MWKTTVVADFLANPLIVCLDPTSTNIRKQPYNTTYIWLNVAKGISQSKINCSLTLWKIYKFRSIETPTLSTIEGAKVAVATTKTAQGVGLVKWLIYYWMYFLKKLSFQNLTATVDLRLNQTNGLYYDVHLNLLFLITSKKKTYLYCLPSACPNKSLLAVASWRLFSLSGKSKNCGEQ